MMRHGPAGEIMETAVSHVEEVHRPAPGPVQTQLQRVGERRVWGTALVSRSVTHKLAVQQGAVVQVSTVPLLFCSLL